MKTTSCAIPQIQRRAKNHTRYKMSKEERSEGRDGFLRKGVIESDLGFGKMMLAVSKE